MSYSYISESDHCRGIQNAPQSACITDSYNSLPSRGIVSDADDDDVSIVGDILIHLKSYNDVKSGSPSCNTCSTFNSSSAFDELHQVTPLCQDSQQIIDKTTTTADTKNGKNSDVPYCPPLSYLTDERMTPLTIQSRDKRAKDSRSELVDEYKVKLNRYDESSKRHAFNTRATLKLEDTLLEKKGNRKTSDLKGESEIHNIMKPAKRISHIITNRNFSNSERSIVAQQRSQQLNSKREQHHINLVHIDDHRKIDSKMPTKANSCLPRQRSRAIAIKRSRPGDHYIDTSPSFESPSDKEARRCDVELYDYATWRMYNRIVDHRRKNLLRMQLQDYHQREEQQNKNNLPSTSNQSSVAHNVDEHIPGTIMHSSTVGHGQLDRVHRGMLYRYDDSFAGSEEHEDQIFDLEL